MIPKICLGREENWESNKINRIEAWQVSKSFRHFSPDSLTGYKSSETSFESYFAKIEKSGNNFGPFYYKITVPEPDDLGFIECRTLYADSLYFYIKDLNGWKEHLVVNTASFNDRTLPVRFLTFRLPFPGVGSVIYLKQNRNINLNLHFFTFRGYLAHLALDYVTWSIFIGGLLIMMLYALTHFGITGERYFLAFFTVVLLELFYILNKTNIGQQFLWPDGQDYLYVLNLYAYLILTISILWLQIELLKLIKAPGIVIKLFLGVLVFKLLLIGLKHDWWAIVDPVFPVFDFVVFPTLWIYSTWMMRRRVIRNFWHIMVMLTLTIGVVIKGLYDADSIPYNQVSYFGIDWGLLATLVFFSGITSSYLRGLKAQKSQAMFKLIKINRKNIDLLEEKRKIQADINLTLEQKVHERTTELALANQEILKLNRQLSVKNEGLTIEIQKEQKARVLNNEMSLEEFTTFFKDEELCIKYLDNLKYPTGYLCRKCGNNKFSLGKMQGSKRCTSCLYDESPTVGTLFYRSRIPLEKAFFMLYLIVENQRVTIDYLADKTGINRITCSHFRNKVLGLLKTSKTRNSREGWAGLILEKNQIKQP